MAKIALDATPLVESTGGIARYTRELSLALAEEFPEDQYWLLSDQPLSWPISRPANLHAGSGPRSPLERKWWLWGVEREMARRGIEMFHGTDFAVPYFPRRPSVMTLHDLTPWMREWQPNAARIRRRTPLLLRLGIATMVITPSEAIRRACIERFGLAADRVAAVPLAANSRFRPVDANPSRPYFLFVGRLEARKNVKQLIEAWRSVRVDHEIDLVLAGRARRDFALPPSETGLRVLGAVSEDELPELYSGALALIYPSHYEGFGLPVLEAMQCGTLAITSRDAAIMEVAAGAAIHVEAGDGRALAEAMAAVARQPEKFRALRERALARSRDFTWRRTARGTREVYDAARRRFGKK
ncbi:MAG TPA: glycosyltransferase family 1 protein [Bryobacteraceae bacterium]|nr:glycosyltransferase family 1 protein [Bryobacteraceae bacterium]